MGKRSTITGYWRARGATNASSSKSTGPSPAVLPMVLQFTVDPAAAETTGLGIFLPLGAIVTNIDIVASHTGGITPLLNIGLGANPDALLDGAVATTNLAINVATATTPGVEFGVVQTVDAEITAGTGGGTPGTLLNEVYMTYIMSDDLSIQD